MYVCGGELRQKRAKLALIIQGVRPCCLKGCQVTTLAGGHGSSLFGVNSLHFCTCSNIHDHIMKSRLYEWRICPDSQGVHHPSECKNAHHLHAFVSLPRALTDWSISWRRSIESGGDLFEGWRWVCRLSPCSVDPLFFYFGEKERQRKHMGKKTNKVFMWPCLGKGLSHWPSWLEYERTKRSHERRV